MPLGETENFLQMVIAKSNYGKRQSKIWMKRSNGGVLKITDLNQRKEQEVAVRNEEAVSIAINKICSLLSDSGALPARVIEEQYGGRHGRLGISQKGVRKALKEGVSRGRLWKNRDATIGVVKDSEASDR